MPSTFQRKDPQLKTTACNCFLFASFSLPKETEVQSVKNPGAFFDSFFGAPKKEPTFSIFQRKRGYPVLHEYFKVCYAFGVILKTGKNIIPLTCYTVRFQQFMI